MDTTLPVVEIEPPFPWIQICALCIGMVAHSVVYTSPMPYVAYMIVDFDMSANLDSAGYYAGLITGAFMLGRTIAGMPWGLASDYFGRKPCLLISMVNVAVFGFIFGFSRNFPFAIAARFAIGLGNGFMGIAKTTVTEVVHSKKQEIKAFGLINGTWGIGLILGPAIGGLLSRPAVQYPHLFLKDSIWAHFPYLLPSIACASFAVTSFFLVYWYLPETGIKRPVSVSPPVPNQPGPDTSVVQSIRSLLFETRQDRDNVQYEMLSSKSEHSSTCNTDNECSDDDDNKDRDVELGEKSKKSTSETPRAHTVADDDDHSHVLSVGIEMTTCNKNDNNDKNNCTSQNQTSGNTIYDNTLAINVNKPGQDQTGTDTVSAPTSSSAAAARKVPVIFLGVIQDRNIQVVLCIYCTYCFVIMFTDEDLPLWAVTSYANGGLLWDSARVGALLASTGAALCVFQLFFYDKFMLRYCSKGAVDSLVKLSVVTTIGALLIPCAAAVALHVSKLCGFSLEMKNTALEVALFVTLVVYRIASSAAFSVMGILINSSVGTEMRGTLNGIVMTAGSIGNGLGPVVGSAVYAMGVDSSLHDGRLIFLLSGVMFTAMTWAIYRCLRD